VKISRVKISNILGLEELEVAPSASGLTVVAGRNKTGKTSFLSALQAALKDRGAFDATLLRQGAAEGEVVLVLDDGTEVRKRVTAEGSSFSVRREDVGRVSSPGAYLDRLLQRESFDLVGFLRAKPAERVEALARAFPVALPEEFWALAGEHVMAGAALSAFKASPEHPLQKVARVEKAIYDARTGINRVAEDKRRTVEELKRTALAGAEDVEDVKIRLQGLESAARDKAEDERRAVAKLEEKRDKEHRETEEFAKAQAASVRADGDKRIAELDAEIAKLREERAQVTAQRDALLKEVATSRDTEIAGETSAFERARADVVAEHREVLATIQADQAALKERLAAAQRAEATRAIVIRTASEAEQREAEAARLTEALEKVRATREAVVAKVPIAGVEVKDGEVCQGGVPFGRLSGAERIRLAFAVAVARLGALRCVTVDGLEQLDAEQLAAIEAEAAAADVQLVCTRVDDGAFRVE
jgi:hypothetical protein